MRLAIHELLAASPPSPEAIQGFVAAHRFPLVEGSSVTFVYVGQADEVRLRHWIFGLPASRPLERVEGTDLWYFIAELPPGSRVEYKLEIVRGEDRTWILDPLNPFTARDPFGANSVCQAAGYEAPEWAREDPDARPGRLEEVHVRSRALGGRRSVVLYLPARMRPSRELPLVVAHDGLDYVRYASLKTVLDNLIHRLELAEIVVAFSNPGNRLVEYADHEPHVRYIAEELVPWLEAEFPLVAAPDGRGLMGASFGAAASFAVARRHPNMFGRMLLQSGSFAFSDIGESERGPLFAPIEAMVNAFRANPEPFSERVFVSCGTFESLIYENRSLVPVLQSTGMEVRYVEARDGHNWENWRDRLRDGLSWLFPGPLWMVYE